MTTDRENQLALVGAAVRLPGANNLEEFWDLCLKGRSAFRDFTPLELEPNAAGHLLASQENFVSSGSILEEIEYFDADFFGMGVREALITDPQHRLFLQCCWHALEEGGLTKPDLQERVGVFAGCSLSSYLLAAMAQKALPESLDPLEMLMSNDKDYLATRVAYKLNLTGPAMTIQTACSTSLSALHVASQSLLNGECDAALVGGSTVLCPQKSGYIAIPGGIHSPEGLCRPFDKAGTGTVFGSGVVAVLLKRLEDAEQDGDPIHAIVLGSAMNNDGNRKVGYTAPSVEGQAIAIAEAIEVAQISSNEIGYVEAHGTGTQLGDPVEISALAKAHAITTEEEENAQPNACYLGSIKGNIGHLDAAAGLAGFLRAALVVKTGKIPPLANLCNANPALDLGNTSFKLPTSICQWPENHRGKRYVGASSFGVGGTNVHVILASSDKQVEGNACWQNGKDSWLAVSAASPDALIERLGQLSNLDASAASIASALAHDHAHLDYRHVVHVPSELPRGSEGSGFSEKVSSAALSANKAISQASKGLKASRPASIFLFPGQGSQFIGMARHASKMDQDFAALLLPMLEQIADLTGLDLRTLMLDASGDNKASDQLKQTDAAQLAIFAQSLCLAQVWNDRGLTPSGLLGHSLGELTAATFTGIFSPDDAISVIAKRGACMKNAPRGAMLAVWTDPEIILSSKPDALDLAGINSAGLCSISGDEASIDAYFNHLQDSGILAKKLDVSHGFHSRSMIDASDEFESYLKTIDLNSPNLAVFSNVTGKQLSAEEATDPAYWARQICQPVQFARNLQEVRKDHPNCAFWEMGAGHSLSQIVHINHPNDTAISLLGPENSKRYPKQVHAHMWEVGLSDLAELEIEHAPQRLVLPPYPFAKQRFWLLDNPSSENFNPSIDNDLGETPLKPSTTEEDPSRTIRASRPALKTAYKEADTPAERLLQSIFAEILCLKSIGVDDNFFDLGGSSVLALKITAACRQHGFGMTPRTIFEHPTISQIASSVAYSELVEQEEDETIFSSWQSVILSQCKTSEDFPAPYRAVLSIEASLNLKSLRNAVKCLVGEHTFLRSCLYRDEGRWHRKSLASDASLYLNEERETLSHAGDEPLFMVSLTDSESKPELVVCVSPLICDQEGLKLLLAELHRHYQADEAVGEPAKPVANAFAAWVSQEMICPDQDKDMPSPSLSSPIIATRDEPFTRHLKLDETLSDFILREGPSMFQCNIDVLMAAAIMASDLPFTGPEPVLWLERIGRDHRAANRFSIAPYQRLFHLSPPIDMAVEETGYFDRLESELCYIKNGNCTLVLRHQGDLNWPSPPSFSLHKDVLADFGGQNLFADISELSLFSFDDAAHLTFCGREKSHHAWFDAFETSLGMFADHLIATRADTLEGLMLCEERLDLSDLSELLGQFE